MGFFIDMVDKFTREVIEEGEEEFDTYEEAEDAVTEEIGAFGVGAEVLEDAGRSFIDPDSVDFVVAER